MRSLIRQRLVILPLLAFLLLGAKLRSDDTSPEKMFAEVPFDQWVKQGPATALPWKVVIQQNGLSLHQRMLRKLKPLARTSYADGAVGNVRKMLAPLPVHVFKVSTAESVRHALARMLAEVAAM